jgi:hypothetical protein
LVQEDGGSPSPSEGGLPLDVVTDGFERQPSSTPSRQRDRYPVLLVAGAGVGVAWTIAEVVGAEGVAGEGAAFARGVGSPCIRRRRMRPTVRATRPADHSGRSK